MSVPPRPLNFDLFHQPYLLPWRTPYCRRLRLAWVGIGEDCRPRTTWRPLTLAGSTGGIATPTRRYHGRTFIRPSSPLLPLLLHVPPSRMCLHTRRFATLTSPPPPVGAVPWRPHPWPALFRLFVWLCINLVLRKQTRVSSLAAPQGDFVLVPFKYYLHGCRRLDPWLLLPWILLFLDTLLPRDTVGSEGVAAVCSGFCARSWVSCQKLQRSRCEYWPFSFYW